MRRALPLVALLLLLAPPARAADLGDLLRKGPLVLIEEKKGAFASATSITMVDAPPDVVWKVLTDFASYKTFMPKTLKSEVTHSADNVRYVEYEIEVPGPNTVYKARYSLDEKALEAKVDWLEGDLAGSRWSWRLEGAAEGKRTIVYHLGSIQNYSSVAASLEDEQQTITVGVNVGSVIAAAKGIKLRAEQLARGK